MIEEINAKRMYEIHNMPAPNINDCIAEAPVSEKDKVRIDAQIFGTGYAEVTENGYRHIPFQRVRTVTRKGGE